MRSADACIADERAEERAKHSQIEASNSSDVPRQRPRGCNPLWGA